MHVGRPSPAMVVALLALFVALGGSGYAAAKLNGSSLENGSVAGKKLKRNTVGPREVRESKLRRVPRARDALRLAGLGPEAFLGAGGKAVDADMLDGLDSAAFLGAGAKAVDADKLDGKDSTAFLAAAGKAVDADELDGLDSSAFLAASKLQAAGPVVLDLPAGSGETSTTTLFEHGPLTVVGECHNLGGGQARARVSVQHDVEIFLLTGDADGKSGVWPVSSAARPIAEATATGGLPVWNVQRRDFSVISNPASGSAAVQGSATAIAVGPPGMPQCYLGAYAVTS